MSPISFLLAEVKIFKKETLVPLWLLEEEEWLPGATGSFTLINSFTGFGYTFIIYDFPHNAFDFHHTHAQSCVGVGG